MIYERITERRETPLTMSMWAGDSKSLQVYNRLAELEDKIESGELIERTSEEYSAVRKQAVKEFAKKLRDKEFSVKIGSEWCAVVKSRDIDEFVNEECGGMRQIYAGYIVKLQAATMRLFEAFDDNHPNWRAISANERAIQRWLDKITDDADEQHQILEIVTRGNWNVEDTTFKPIFDELRALGYEIVIERAQK